MRVHEFIKEAVGPSMLYHTTTEKGLRGMISKGQILPSNPKIAHGWGFGGVGDHGNISLTRDPNYWPFDFSDIQIYIDRNALRNHHRIEIYGSHNEFEERVTKPIPFNNTYIKKVYFRDEIPSTRITNSLKKLGIPFEIPDPSADIFDPAQEIKNYQRYR